MAIQVLIVDDHAVLRAGLRMLLDAEPDIEVIGEAQNGATAIQMVENNPPDVVVLDINMPGKDGIETLNDIVSERGSLPVILHTAYSAYKDNYMTWSAVEYVVKSAAGGFKELKEAVAKAVSTSE